MAQIAHHTTNQAALEAEEKRLLDSFKLHEFETGVNDSPNSPSQVTDTLFESQVENSPKTGHLPDKVYLQKEEELLGGTFGDPSKLPRREHLDYSQKSDEEYYQQTDHTAEIVIRQEPGPAFANSSFKEGSPIKPDEDGVGNKENPFYWADNPSGDNMSKLVSFNNQTKIKQKLKERQQIAGTASEQRFDRSISKEKTPDHALGRTAHTSTSEKRKLNVYFCK